jgi:hypothetical protein
MAGHIACRGKKEMRAGFWWSNPKERVQFVDLGVDGRIILNGY